jgi:hypothetical protein
MRKTLPFLFKFIVSGSIFYVLLNNVNISKTIQSLVGIHKGYLTIAVLAMFIQIIVASTRWKIVLSQFDIFVSFKEVIQMIWIGLFFNQILPSSIGGDTIRSYYLYKKNHTLGLSVLCVLADRMIGLIALVIFVLATLTLAFDLITEPKARWGISLIAIGSTLGVIIILTLNNYTKKVIHVKLIRGLLSISLKCKEMIFSISPGIKLISISLGIHILTIITITFLSLGMNLNIYWLGLIIIMPLTSLIMVVPISIAGWGVREGVMVIGLGFLGVASENALALSLSYGILMFIIYLPGLAIWLMSGHLFTHQVK